jgi:hypothetical protein
MVRENNISRTISILALLLSLLALFAATADAQMNRDSPSFETRIPRMTESFLTSQPQTATPAAPSLTAYSLSYPAPPDISISADQRNTTCHQVSFIVTLTPNPSSASPSGNQAVKVRVTDKVFGNRQVVAEVVLFVPGSGGSTAATIGYPQPEDAFAGPGWSNDIEVTADPDNQIMESNESNNSLTISGTCS